MRFSGLRLAAKLAVFFATLYFIMATPLLAEDIAQRRIIGFSADGNYFAFEQSGILNGSGDAYAEIFLIDTRRNSWVEGSPFRARGKGGAGALRRVRGEVIQAARPALRKYGVRQPGVVLASNPITEISALPNRVTVSTRRSLREQDKPLVFSIEEVKVPTPRCRSYTDQPVKGMIIRVRKANGRDEVLHEDERIPTSRGCPVSYRIEDVVRLHKAGGGVVYVVIYSFVSAGERGEELRYIAGGWHDDEGDYSETEASRDMYDYSGRPDYAGDVDDDGAADDRDASDERDMRSRRYDDMDKYDRRGYYRDRWDRRNDWIDSR